MDHNIKPVFQRIPLALEQNLKDKLAKLEKEEIITKQEKNTDWVSHTLIVNKDKSFRICLNPISLNYALKRPNFQFTTLEGILLGWGRVKIFSTVDTKKVRMTEIIFLSFFSSRDFPAQNSGNFVKLEWYRKFCR